MTVAVVIGSRADDGLLQMPIRALQAEPSITVRVLRRPLDGHWADPPDWLILLGDRVEIMQAALTAHLLRVPIVHLCAGDVTEGSYDDAMRDCISRLATIRCATSEAARDRLLALGYAHVYLIGNPGLDFIRHGDWRRARPMKEPYVLVSYQAETIDGTNEIEAVLTSLPEGAAVILMPNPDAGSERIRDAIEAYCLTHPKAWYVDQLPHGTFLNYLVHCEEFVGNSSAIFYEAPELGVRTRLIGKRQQGRVRPWGDGRASERLVRILKEWPCAASS